MFFVLTVAGVSWPPDTGLPSPYTLRCWDDGLIARCLAKVVEGRASLTIGGRGVGSGVKGCLEFLESDLLRQKHKHGDTVCVSRVDVRAALEQRLAENAVVRRHHERSISVQRRFIWARMRFQQQVDLRVSVELRGVHERRPTALVCGVHIDAWRVENPLQSMRCGAWGGLAEVIRRPDQRGDPWLRHAQVVGHVLVGLKGGFAVYPAMRVGYFVHGPLDTLHGFTT